ncbi:hypothetical protein PybrP1_006108, partial [[Pythium] brassicae (nom. inval.)]
MSALIEYRDRTSFSRVLLVYMLSVLPSLGAIVLLDALPLEDPTLGWDKNSTFWLRSTLATFGWTRFAQVPEIKTQLTRFSNYFNVATMLLVIYPLYSTVFQSLRGASQFAFLFVLPVIKF